MRFFAAAAWLVILGVAAPASAGQPKKPASPKQPKPVPPKPVPPTPEKIRADKLFDDGRKYLIAKEFALACTAFEQSHEADPAIGTQLNIALCYEEWGKVAAAYRAFLEAERLAKLKSDPEHREVGARMKVDLLAPKVPHLRAQIPADADVATVFTLDAKEIDRAQLADDQLVEPGPHIIEARVPGKPAKQTKVDLKLGERRVVAIDVPRPDVRVIVTIAPRRKGRFYGGLGLATFGAITVGGAGFLALLARQDYNDAIGDCPNQLCESRAAFNATHDARNRATYMTFIGAGGALVGVVGVYLVLTSRGQKTEQKQTVEITPLVGNRGIGLAIGGSL